MTVLKQFSTGPIRAVDFQRFAITVGDHNPIYFDTAAARAAGYRDIVAPPNYVTSVLNWDAGPADTQLQADGAMKSTLPAHLQGKKAMGGGQELSFGAPVYDGDTLQATVRVIDSQQKRTSSGKDLWVTVTQTDYLNQHGELVVSCKFTILSPA